MTLTHFVTKSAFRNKRRSLLTVLSMAFSLLLLTLMITIWKGFYIDQQSAEAAQRLITRHRVSLTFFIPGYYREKIRAVPGVVAVAPVNWFGGIYKDAKPENFFAQFGTDPMEIMSVLKDFKISPEELQAWQRDRAGAIVSQDLAEKQRFKVGDRITLKGTIYPVNLELTIRGIFKAPEKVGTLYFDQEYVQQAVSFAKGQAGTFSILADSPQSVTRIATTIDDMFHNSPQPTKTESEKAFQLGFVAMLGNVKAFILSICGAVVFAILLVSGNTMAMSVRERTREVAVLKTLGFTRGTVLSLFVGEAVALAAVGGIIGALLAKFLVAGMANVPMMSGFFANMKVGISVFAIALFVAALVGFLSAVFPAYNASRVNIVDGLRHIG